MFIGAHRLRIVVNCLAKLRKEAGKNDIGMASVEDSAAEIAQFVLKNGTEEQWPLVSIGPLHNNDAWDLSQGLVSMKSSASSDSEKSAKAKAAAKKGQKRPLDHIQDEDEADASKRLRMTLQPDQDVSNTRINDSLAGQPSQIQLSSEMNALKDLLKATEQQLHDNTTSSDKRIQGLDVAIADLQFRFEEQTLEKRTVAKELTETKAALEHSRRQKEARDTTIDKLKEDVRDLKAQLSEVHLALGGSQIPEVAELERLREEKEQADNAKRRAEKAAESQESMMGYVRQQLDEARSRAIELVEQNREYETKIGILERQATGDISKARQMFLDDRAKNEASENIRLRQENRNLQQLLQRKEDELKTRKVGMGTRAGSVPRSPRVGPSSRGGSPIPDRRIGALKSNMNL
jgi:hypothetical protein